MVVKTLKLQKYPVLVQWTGYKEYVYFLIRQDKIVYVGRTHNLLQRIGSHLSSGKIFDCYSYIEVSSENAGEIEKRYIQQYQPEYNLQYKNQ